MKRKRLKGEGRRRKTPALSMKPKKPRDIACKNLPKNKLNERGTNMKKPKREDTKKKPPKLKDRHAWRKRPPQSLKDRELMLLKRKEKDMKQQRKRDVMKRKNRGVTRRQLRLNVLDKSRRPLG